MGQTVSHTAPPNVLPLGHRRCIMTGSLGVVSLNCLSFKELHDDPGIIIHRFCARRPFPLPSIF
ncbi:hypothetical protein [Jannaschia donghaensis]|uniref:hypothetical protein n=1 Tax=Jannaschia donghaensis TaxID=420998 RepID=UPI00118761B2|nr:hypothetical protein [Jannaschia donghaensis]